MNAPFERFSEALASHSPTFRAEVACHGADADWRLLALECRDRVERQLCPDPVLDYVRKRHQPSMRSQAATSQHPGAVALSNDDPLKRTPPSEYVEAFTGERVPPGGKVRCPLHDDSTPSFQVYEDHWHCFGCHTTGGVYELASRITGLSTRGPEFLKLRRWIAAALLERRGVRHE